MKIDKVFLDEQIAQYNAQAEELKANLNATLGAIELCQHFLKVLDMEEPKKEEVPELKDLLPKGAKIGGVKMPCKKGKKGKKKSKR